MYTSSDVDFPRLKSRAAETKELAAALLHVFSKFMDGANEQHRLIKLLLTLVVRLETITAENKESYTLPDDVAEDWLKTGQGIFQVNTKLAHFFHPKRIMLFHVTIKFHYLLHLALIGKVINPRLAWCYAGESMMLVVKRIVQSSHLGSPPQLVVNKVMAKYARGLSLACCPDVWKR